MTSETLAKIKALSVIEVAEKLGFKVIKKKALCFEHDDKHPSLNFNEKTGRYRCYACDAKGDLINLVEKNLKLSFVDACKWLVAEFNIYTDDSFRPFRFKKINRPVKYSPPVVESPFQPDPEIYEWLIKQLSLSKTGIDYLVEKRGFSREIIEQLEIRDITDTNAVFGALKEEWGTERLVNCGLMKTDDSGDIKKIWWDYTIVFPFVDLNYRIKYLQGRRLYLERIPNKYVNLSKIRPYVYNIHTLTEINPKDRLYICEGIPDTVTASLLGMKAIGVLGASSFDSELVDILSPYRLGIIPDVDKGGQTFLENVRKAFLAKGKTVQKYNVPKPYNDLNEYFIAKNSRPQ